ncbi:nicotinamide mononucleotide transporter [Planctomonas sp. JC2975]|uniref:nicotinamide mononucleotide transporter family protein n=1 Tax=Planctomonas sp. JC2975 TaxID=2729626 RepID=UPI00147322D6|nr:nicotinamide mononucleotide transporter family protein [Planctomonas sp. JC2975]NNC11441.1 nicotinamide mononucleotide transporter [Planctomonas sp. JC2975]
MFAVLDWINGPFVTLGTEAIALPSVLGALAFLVCEGAAARGARWVWSVGAIAALVLAALALVDGRWVDSGIRIVVAALCAYGWRHRRSQAMAVRFATGREMAYGVVLFAIATVVVAYALTAQTEDSVSWGGAVVVAALFVQLAALARGLVTGWWVVLAGAVVSLGLAAASGSWAGAIVSAAAGALAVYGWVQWRRDARASEVLDFPIADEIVDEDLVA